MTKKVLGEDLELDGTVEAAEKKAAVKEFTEEDAKALEAGIVKLNEFNLSDKFKFIVSELVPNWPKGSDSEDLKKAKETVINYFGGSDKLKDYVDAEFQDELNALLGAQKALSVLNNIKSFYARRAGTTKKVPTQKVKINGTLYSVSREYFESIATETAENKKALLLAHASTKPVTEDILELL
jgi:hypothetical protein